VRVELVEKLSAIISAAVREAIARADVEEPGPEQIREPRLLTARQVADRLQVNTQAVYRLTREGKLPAVKLSERTLRWSEKIIGDFVARGGVDGLQPADAGGDATGSSPGRRTVDGTD
jgi:excisionase family DNA binding protein